MEISTKEWEEVQLRLEKLQILENLGVDKTPILLPHLEAWNKKHQIRCLKQDLIEDIQQTLAEENEWEFPAGREAGISVCFTSQGEQMVISLFENFHNKVNEIEKEYSK